MKLALFFLGVCLAQAALNPEELREKVFEQGKEYVYKYEGDVKSGIPQTSDKYSGMKIEAEVRLQFKTDKDVLMRLEKIRFMSLRGEMESPEERELRLLAKDPKEEKRPEQRQRHAFDQEFQKSTEFELDFDSEERLSVERTLSEEQERRDQQERNQKKSRKSSSEQEESIWEASREVQEEVSETEKSMTELRRHLEKTVLVRYEKGNVTKIEAQKDEPQESVNIKRGIWNMLQVTMDPKNVETLDKDSKDKSKSNRAYDKSTEKLFRIMEQDVSGQCETQYDIRESRLQKNLFEVTKTKDYQNCRQKVEKLHSLLSAKKSKDERKDRKEDKLESSSVSRLLVVSDKLRSDKFLIQQSEVRSQHVFQPYSKQGGEEESQRTDSEERREEKTQERKEKIERLSKEISKEMKHSVSEQAPRKFVELVKELRQLNEEQMKKILKELITKPLNQVRVQAIDAMSRVAKKLPNKVRQIALRVFQNPEKSESERIRAYELMMKTKPTLSFIELIAQSTQRETSNQVGQYVYTDLKSRSESKLQQDKKMSQQCKIALRLCKPFNKGIQYSESRKFQMVDEDLDMGVSLDLKSISDKKSIFPKDVRAQLRLSALGYDIELLEIAGRAEGLQSMIDSVLSKKQEEKKSVFDYMMKKTRESSEEYRKTKEQRQKNIADIETEKIQRSLPIETRRDEEPRLTYSTKWSDNEISFQQFDKEELKKMVREGKLPMSDLEEQLRKGLKHQTSKTTFLVEASRQIPTTLGLPLHLNLTSVLMVKSKSEGKLEVTPRMFREDRPREQKEQHIEIIRG
uniref:Vitellogenin domain-containing protein n=1 Tax=Branchiostoma floridae TaxID=7739 RepID=C3ZJ90_BRAFL|eukprot:XP_002591410.1 hypothetical protein BRAFLDRAFT_69973 [Branchiostoma floridae]